MWPPTAQAIIRHALLAHQNDYGSSLVWSLVDRPAPLHSLRWPCDALPSSR
jgi:hypothetical protein